jgi:trehalose 6-phosphate phosphatase
MPSDPDARSLLNQLAARLPNSLLAFDFDGTLSPIVIDPQQARPAPGTLSALRRLADTGAQIAIITGRGAETAVELGEFHRVPRVIVSGLHGAERWQQQRLTTRPEPAGLAELRTALPPLLANVDDRIWLEDKRLSLVVHTRPAVDPAASQANLAEPVTALARQHGLAVVPGKYVLEIRIPNLSKADALSQLLTDEVSAALFAGDDLGDLPAFARLAQWRKETGRPAISIAVGEVAEVQAAADLVLDEPAALVTLLSALTPVSQ